MARQIANFGSHIRFRVQARDPDGNPWSVNDIDLTHEDGSPVSAPGWFNYNGAQDTELDTGHTVYNVDFDFNTASVQNAGSHYYTILVDLQCGGTQVSQSFDWTVNEASAVPDTPYTDGLLWRSDASLVLWRDDGETMLESPDVIHHGFALKANAGSEEVNLYSGLGAYEFDESVPEFNGLPGLQPTASGKTKGIEFPLTTASANVDAMYFLVVGFNDVDSYNRTALDFLNSGQLGGNPVYLWARTNAYGAGGYGHIRFETLDFGEAEYGSLEAWGTSYRTVIDLWGPNFPVIMRVRVADNDGQVYLWGRRVIDFSAVGASINNYSNQRVYSMGVCEPYWRWGESIAYDISTGSDTAQAWSDIEQHLARKYDAPHIHTFTPGSEPSSWGLTLEAHYVADDINAGSASQVSGGKLIKWVDSSGNGHDLEKPASTQAPAYQATGYNGTDPLVVFNGSDEMLELTTNHSPAIDRGVVAIVMESDYQSGAVFATGYNGSKELYIGSGTASSRTIAQSGSGTLYGPYSTANAGQGQGGGADTTTAYHVVFLHFDNKDMYGSGSSPTKVVSDAVTNYPEDVRCMAWVNGFPCIEVIDDNVGSAYGEIADFHLAADINKTNFANMRVREVMVYSGDAWPNHLAFLLCYLSNKHGIFPL